MILPLMLLSMSMALNGTRVPPCPAPTIGVPGRLPVGLSVTRDSFTVSDRPMVSAADSQAVRSARVDLGVKCAIAVIADLGGLRAAELHETAGACGALPPRGREAPTSVRLRPGSDWIALCRVYITRDQRTRDVLHAELWLVAIGGRVERDGTKRLQNYDVRLRRLYGSREWSVVSYAVLNPE